MALNISAWSIRNPLPSVVFSIILVVLGWLSFTKLAVTHLPSADIPVISVAVAQFGAAPAELESQVTKVDRGRRLRRRRRPPHQLLDHRRPVGDDDRVLDRDQYRPRHQRHQGRGHPRARQPAAERQRAADPARRRDRPADRHLRGDLARQDAGATVVFRRRRRQTRAAGRARRRRSPAYRRCRARDPGLARSRQAAGRGPHGGQCQPAFARHQRGPGRRPRRNRPQRPGDPHARRRQDAERSRRHHDPAVRRRRNAHRRSRHRHRHHRRPPHLRPRQWRAGGGVRHQARQGRQRRGGGRGRAEAHRRDQGGQSGIRPQDDRHLGEIHQGQLRGRDLDLVRGRHPRRHHRDAVPARHPRHPDLPRFRCRCRSSPPSGRWTSSASR